MRLPGRNKMSDGVRIQGVACYGRVTDCASYVVAGLNPRGYEYENIVSCSKAKTWPQVVTQILTWAEKNGLEIFEIESA